MGHRYRVAIGILLALVPFALEVDSLFRGVFVMTNPMRDAVVIDEDVGPDNLSAMTAETFYQKGVAFQIDILDDPEDALLRVYGAESTVGGNPELGQVVPDEISPDHGRRRLAATGRRRTGEEGLSPARSGHAGDEHML